MPFERVGARGTTQLTTTLRVSDQLTQYGLDGLFGRVHNGALGKTDKRWDPILFRETHVADYRLAQHQALAGVRTVAATVELIHHYIDLDLQETHLSAWHVVHKNQPHGISLSL